MLNKPIKNLGLEYTLLQANNANSEKLYRVSQLHDDIFPVKIKGAVFTTNNDDIVNQIFVDFVSIMDKDFYSFLTSKYGIPSHILKPDPKATVVTHKVENGIEITSHSGKAVACAFIDNPSTIIWVFNDFSMTFNIIREKNKMELIVTKN